MTVLGLLDYYDSIFVVVDWLTKYIYFILYKESINTEEFIIIFHRIVISQHGILAEIILDQDKLFISKF